MKKLLISVATTALLAGTAAAADLPAFEPAPVLAPVPQIASWSGAYIGIHGGFGWAEGKRIRCPAAEDNIDLNGDGECECPEDGNFVVDGDDDWEGAVLGAQIGVNWQINMFVIGAEADLSWANLDGDDLDDDDDDDDDDDFFEDGDGIDWLASIRARAGVGFDRVLIYGTGGIAFTEFDHGDAGDDETQVGWVAGGGAEFLVTNNVSIGAEYLHYEFEDGLDGDIVDGDDDDVSVDVIRGRVNFKFGGGFLGG